MPKTLILCSGGLKSAFLISLAFREDQEPPELVFFDYQQKNCNQEYAACQRLAAYHGSPIYRHKQPKTILTRIDLLCVTDFILRAIPIARTLGCYRVYFGWSRDDWQRIPEIATREIMANYLVHLKNFMFCVQSTYDIHGMYCGRIEIDMPLYLLTEAHVIRLGNEYTVPWHHTWSCLENEKVHCGQCQSCRRRQVAFLREGTIDPVEYRSQYLKEITDDE